MRRGLRISPVLAISLSLYLIGLLILGLWQITHQLSSVGEPVPPPVAVTIVSNPPTNTPVDTVLVGQPAPDFQLTGLDGQPHHLQDYLGKPILLNFWATWCGPCRREMPLLQKTAAEFQPNALLLIGVDQGENAATVSAYVKELGITFPILLDEQLEATEKYRVIGLPTSFFIDTHGIIRSKNVGVLSDETLQDHLDRLMGLNSVPTVIPETVK